MLLILILEISRSNNFTTGSVKGKVETGGDDGDHDDKQLPQGSR